MALMALPLAQCSCYFIVITAGCVRPSERDFVNSRWLKASLFSLVFWWRRAVPTGGETVGWLGNRMIYDRHARLPQKTHFVGFNLDLDHQPLPTDSAEWRRMMRQRRPRTDPHRQNPPRRARHVSGFAAPLFVVIVRLALWRHIQSMYANSVLFASCTFIPMIVLLYFM